MSITTILTANNVIYIQDCECNRNSLCIYSEALLN